MCDQRFILGMPSELPAHVSDVAADRRVALRAMHPVDDSFAYAVWSDGELARSLSFSLPSRIAEGIGGTARVRTAVLREAAGCH